MIRIESVEAPFTTASLVRGAVAVLSRIDAMGLLPKGELIQTLDLPALRKVMRHVHRAGIGRTVSTALSDELAGNSRALEQTLRQINTALEESPAPDYEWKRLSETLDVELLVRLLGISETSLRRYRSAARTTPDDVAVRLHFLALLVSDLLGAYNELGIRQWFHRKRAQLRGKAPLDLLAGVWDPTDAGPVRVRELARSLTASPAT